MSDFDKIFEQFQFSVKADKPIKEFSNWIFGISIGFCALLIFQMKDFDLNKFCFTKILYKTIVIFSMLNAFLTGFTKYLIINRDIIMNIKYGALKKLLQFATFSKRKPEDVDIDLNKILNEWTIEFNKIKNIGQFLNISIWTTFVTILITGILLLILL